MASDLGFSSLGQGSFASEVLEKVLRPCVGGLLCGFVSRLSVIGTMEGMQAAPTVVFLHGMGESADAWDAQRAALPSGVDSLAVDVFGSGDVSDGANSFSLVGAADAVLEQIERQGAGRVHLCGLSLGAMIALQVALDHPERVRSLTLAAGQVKPPRALMAVQGAVLRLLPAKMLEKQGARKDVMLSVMRAVGRADFSDRLGEVSVPVLVLCGERDRPNMPAARALAAGIRGAELRIIPGAGHQSHIQAPEAFATLLGDFLTRVSAQDVDTR